MSLCPSGKKKSQYRSRSRLNERVISVVIGGLFILSQYRSRSRLNEQFNGMRKNRKNLLSQYRSRCRLNELDYHHSFHEVQFVSIPLSL